MVLYITNGKIIFIMHSCIILILETTIYFLQNTIFFWILRIFMVFLVIKIFRLLIRKTNYTQIDFFPAMLFINIMYIFVFLNIIYEFLPNFFNFIFTFLMISFYYPMFKQINIYNKLIEEGYDPLFDKEVFYKKVHKWFKNK